jgi:predicted dinucleotide-binding enzyme
MTYSIIGSGAIGTALARQFARTNTPVLIANTRGPSTLADLTQELGSAVRPVKLSDALQADTIILAVPFSAVEQVAGLAPDWSGRVVIDATNAIDFTDFSPADLGGRLSSDIVAAALPGAAIVKAFNTLPAAVLAQEPTTAEGKRTVFHSSNSEQATAVAAELITTLGYAPINLGRIDEGGRLQQFGGPLMVHSLIKQA